MILGRVPCTYLLDYLYFAFEGDMMPEEWGKAFDIKSSGIRSAYSIKVQDDVIVSRRRYVHSVPQEWGRYKKWWVMLQKVHVVGLLVRSFDPSFFLYEWSKST